MRFLKKIFKTSTGNKSFQEKPDNERLFTLLEKYIQDYNYDNYKTVATELIEGNAFLLLPQYKNKGLSQTWEPAKAGQKIDLGIYFVDRLKAIAAFTSEEALYGWAKKPTKYVAMSSKTVIKICDENGVRRIVIDSNQRTMFLLQREQD